MTGATREWGVADVGASGTAREVAEKARVLFWLGGARARKPRLSPARTPLRICAPNIDHARMSRPRPPSLPFPPLAPPTPNTNVAPLHCVHAYVIPPPPPRTSPPCPHLFPTSHPLIKTPLRHSLLVHAYPSSLLRSLPLPYPLPHFPSFPSLWRCCSTPPPHLPQLAQGAPSPSFSFSAP